MKNNNELNIDNVKLADLIEVKNEQMNQQDFILNDLRKEVFGAGEQNLYILKKYNYFFRYLQNSNEKIKNKI